MVCPKLVITLFFILITLCAGCISTLEYPRELQKSERYQLQIDTSAPLYDATFFVPLPVKNGGVMIGDKQLNANDFAKEGFSVDFIQTPPGYNLSGFYPGDFSFRGNDPWFMRIHADVWPKGRNEWFAADGANDLSSPLLFYNTLYPIGNESILLPKLDFAAPNPSLLKKDAEYGIFVYDKPPYSGSQSGMVYAYYNFTGETRVDIYISVEGVNSWRDMDDTGPSNSYLDQISGIVYNRKGWNKFSGIFDAATWNNNYPDLSSPRWQKLIQRNQSST